MSCPLASYSGVVVLNCCVRPFFHPCMKVLSLSNCSSLSDRSLYALAAHCPSSLTSLHISGYSERLTVGGLGVLLEACTALSSVRLPSKLLEVRMAMYTCMGLYGSWVCVHWRGVYFCLGVCAWAFVLVNVHGWLPKAAGAYCSMHESLHVFVSVLVCRM